MGLDMYLRGEKFIWTDWEKPENNPMEDGFKLQRKELELGYWRKHPDLHGYIVKTFAGGVDECQRIDLDAQQIKQIIDAIKAAKLPETKGFFFGESGEADEQRSTEQLTKALEWLETKEQSGPKTSRSVFYKASW